MRTLFVLLLIKTLSVSLYSQGIVETTTKRIEDPKNKTYTSISYDFSGKVNFSIGGERSIVIGEGDSITSAAFILNSFELFKIISLTKEKVLLVEQEIKDMNTNSSYRYTISKKTSFYITQRGNKFKMSFLVTNKSLEDDIISISLSSYDPENQIENLLWSYRISRGSLEKLYDVLKLILEKEAEIKNNIKEAK